MSKIIMGIELRERVPDACEVQRLLTKYGCGISTRIGLHTASKDVCGAGGLIVLEWIDGADSDAAALKCELDSFGGVTVKTMEF